MARSTPPHQEPRAPTDHRWSLVGVRALLLAFLWWVLAGDDLASWWIGVPCIFLAVLASIALAPRRRWVLNLPGLLAFLPFFLHRTVRGSVDVAWRAVHPRIPIDPGLVYYHLRIPECPGRLIFASAINLLPGTVCAEFVGNRFLLHVIDRGAPDLFADLERLERRIDAALTPVPEEES